ncbi:NAD-dependent epimerase/dehydratase family protein [Latilactobacillus curvatus]|uniref:GDP-mannose 4,6-dehydratase n=1 Tax=Latilactobacillus curvatus TaxID=28038 RepID=UPI000975B0F4|nr:GDP-mannose 4,6-dehydratase [Latilactobacillus curvatus]MCP8858518.1 GDP-mannose 4,6-dehydratase [Latilactobacillus curvatus]MCT1215752.1 NAD-dependent epimerase/dehydratase family protein [Latilactobacillus curvatus]
MSKVLITGGAGFIGSTLADKLVEEGNEVVIVDDLSMGSTENIPQSINVTFYEESITNHFFMTKLLITNNFDYIYLLAAVASVADSIERPIETHAVNQNANLNILETIRKEKLTPKKIVFSSSAAVYGNGPELPKKETSAINPMSPYAIDKFATERFMVDYGQLYGLPTVCTRFFNVYGPKQNPKSPYSGVLSIISDCLVRDNIFNLFGDGSQTRDYVYIDDVVDALLLLATTPEAKHDVYNVATGESISLVNVIKAYESAVGRKVKVVKKEARLGDVQDSLADITKLRGLGYEPKVNVTAGLAKYWDALQEK